MERKETGRVSQVIGPVVDVYFENDADLPNIYDALEVTNAAGIKIILEVQQDIEKIQLEL